MSPRVVPHAQRPTTDDSRSECPPARTVFVSNESAMYPIGIVRGSIEVGVKHAAIVTGPIGRVKQSIGVGEGSIGFGEGPI